MAWVSLNVVDGSVMLTLVQTELQVDFDLLSLVGLEDVALLGTDQVLQRRSISVILQAGAAKDLGHGLTVDLEVLNELEFLCGTRLEVSLIPPEEATVGGGRDTLDTRLACDPVDIVDWVMMRLLEHRGQSWAD